MEQPILANLDDIVFEARNKEYGAYALRQKYSRSVVTAFLFGTAFVLFALMIPAILTWIENSLPQEEELKKVTIVEMTEAPPIDKEKQPELPPEELAPPPKKSAIKFVIPEPVPDEEAKPEETIVDIDSIKDKNVATETVEGSEEGFDFGEKEGTGVVEAPKDDTPDPNDFILAEKEPAPVNMSEFKKNIGYPPQAKEANISGKVILKVLVDKEGNIEKHILVKSPHPLLANACVAQLPLLKFTPAVQAGKPIKFWVVVPVDFKLQ
ncbi:MAG: energy transducer TonB [Sphingobacteriia bacterium]|jgi:protein TonB|nr:energy transducer TonB [Sphingobacteriia bacterium]